MDGLRELGVEVWFNLGDRDLAIAIERARLLADGRQADRGAAGDRRPPRRHGRVLPMSDHPVRTRVMARRRSWPFQEFMISGRGRDRSRTSITEARRPRLQRAEVSPRSRDARAIVIGPSNPVISIGPILALPGMRAALAASAAPVVAVSPLVGGAVVKGPTEPFLRWAGQPCRARASRAGTRASSTVSWPISPTELVPVLRMDVLMDTPAARPGRRADVEFRARARPLACQDREHLRHPPHQELLRRQAAAT